MKVLKLAVIACSLSAALAHAQTAPAAAEQHAAAANAQQASQPQPQGRAQRASANPAVKAEECVGPVSYCNLFFGS
ncbi:hypothetical protein EN871_19885 [bacterium M00.F.Ca.ET.228.01.1.1]|uniref:hypothetical protein n=1 Tax=Paraburkholderia phenoliruptrix TaxID=252970 RepID=UPI001091F46A|nr:hypothetical protein [Paraburkholderia phenoliruptrix]TGP42446.1 hypothetical protein EN871_19885 [bacterium M00.F.Ca.ET.228.01.1.1]TGS00097.1 hypothetical protein EN834_18070 [bacterium M00.F.Ca.ET.191.01.1.1]TGU04417.1 hypothetical protein EN798_18890 [bacterium M00.F.Ca.ET.155.01.1.1]MBW0449924.1 hypothetical protein [Paraburkholderia phenoliruptrix]MBW9098676.1 hypothetical protein [Paraburkholderia phenoliruptrix]